VEGVLSMLCSKCGAQLLGESAFCAYCDEQQSRLPTFCAKCHVQLQAGAYFCACCGEKQHTLSQDESPYQKKEITTIRTKNLLLSIIFLAISAGGAVFIFLLSWLLYGRIYFFQGSYAITKIGWIIVYSLGTSGMTLFLIGLKDRKRIGNFKHKLIAIIILLALIPTILTSAILVNYCDDNAWNTSKSTSFDDYVNKYRYLVDLKVSDIILSSNSVFTKATGTITNIGSEYSYRFVKVYATFKNANGTVIDTDWTYAVDSAWLRPGESKKFEVSVTKDSSIRSCAVIIMMN